jgi:fermentation-respiration switch protein FrsA (DUF1100 family)
MSGRLVFGVLAVLLLALFILIALTASQQGRLLFFPTHRLIGDPHVFNLDFEPLSPKTSDGETLHGWWIRGRGRAAVLYFHGNAGNIADRLDRAQFLVQSLGLDVFLVDYRGYGQSTGKPSEDGLYADGVAIYEAALARGFPASRIVLLGESLGAGVALETALRKKVAGVILEMPFLSIPAMARRYYPWVPAPLVLYRFDNGERIAKLDAPKLVAQAENDDIVPPEQTRRLFELARPPKTYFVLPGAQHNDLDAVRGPAYRDAWNTFLDAALSAEPAR